MKKTCTGCVVSAGTHKPAEALHQQIAEPKSEALRLADECEESAAYWALEIDTRLNAAKMLRAQHSRIAELEGQLEAIGAGGVEPLRKPAAPQAVQAAVPDNWRDQFSEAVYEDLSAADNQDVPLEEYPARILNVLDAIVGPRHPTVIKWRNDAIRSCIAIAYKYCSDPESYRYLKQDLEAMLAAPAHPAEGVPAQCPNINEPRGCWRVACQLGGKCREPERSATQPAAQGMEKDAARYRFLRDGDWRENDDLAPFIHLQLNALWDEKIDAALAAQAKHGEQP